ncbi:MAG: terminase small subunit protein [Candidatus Kaiserbacteria bacterium]|nr:terminase small subunit protein [Candidatus Kaiserbacteria bacterium]
MAQAPKIRKRPTRPGEGHPPVYSFALAQKICSRISKGESIRHIVRDKDMPSPAIIFRWLLDPKKQEFWEIYEKARNIQAELMFEELLDIADDGFNDYMLREGKDGEDYEVVNAEHIQRSKLRVDTRKWYLSKVLPRKFGERSILATEDKDGNVQPITGIVINNPNDTAGKDTGNKS